MNLEENLKRCADNIRWLDKQIDGIAIPSDVRCRLAGGCLYVALEHQKAIVLLIDNKIYGPALALVRLLIEAYVRGVWLHKCAAEVDLEKFKVDKLERLQASLIADIELLEGFQSKVLSGAHNNSWKKMCSFTHTGFQQVVRNNTAETIEPNYDAAELIETLEFANATGFLSAIAIAGLANNNSLANAVLRKMQQSS